VQPVSVWCIPLLLLMASPAWAVDRATFSTEAERGGSPAERIQLDRDRLTVQLKEAPLKAVLEEVGRRAGIEMTIHGPLMNKISMEFHDFPLEQGLQRLLRGCGWIMISTRRDGYTLEKVIVVPNNESLHLTQRQELPPAEGTQEAKGPPADQADSGQDTKERPAAQSLRMIANIAVLFLRDIDPKARLDAWEDFVNSVNAEEVGRVIHMLTDESVQSTEWETALAPLSKAMSAEEREFIMSSLQIPEYREYMVRMLEPVQLFKTAAAAETR
jgi:hypothetical protein